MPKLRIAIIIFLGLNFPFSLSAFNESTSEFTQAEKYFESGNYKQSEQCYRLAADKYKGMGNLAAYIQSRIGECLQYQGRTEEAVQVYRKVQAEYPQSPQAGQAQEQIARVYYQAGDYAKAGPEFEKLAERKKTAMDNIQASMVPSEQTMSSSEALGYAAYCYEKTGNKIKAAALAANWNRKKDEIR